MGVQEEKRVYKCLGRSRITPLYGEMRFDYAFFCVRVITKCAI
jgi:hypothetical protein